MYECVDGQWLTRVPLLERRGRLSHHQYRREGVPAHLPDDWEPAICTGTVTKVTSTCSTPQLPPSPPPPTPASFLERCHNSSPGSQWATASTTVDDNGAYVAVAVRAGTAIAVSDGSHKGQQSAAAFAIEGVRYNHHRISGTCTTPGHLDKHDPYS
eukprot:6910587-Ditylum_brightwellii.AAC.1